MKKLIAQLQNCSLFDGYSVVELEERLRLSRHRTATFSRGQIIAAEGAFCNYLSIVLAGAVEIQKSLESGKVVTLQRLTPASVFAEGVVFAKSNQYPATITASESETSVFFIRKDEIIQLCRTDKRFLQNFLSLLSDRILFLNQKVKTLSYQTVREKVAHLLLQEYRRQASPDLELAMTRQETAELLDIPRPSLSRELSKMQREGLLTFSKNQIRLFDIAALEDFLFGS